MAWAGWMERRRAGGRAGGGCYGGHGGGRAASIGYWAGITPIIYSERS